MPVRLHPYTLILLMSLFIAPGTIAQPYIDLLQARYVYSPHTGNIPKDKHSTELNYLNIGATLPFQFKNKQDALVLAPYFERWESKVDSSPAYNRFHYGIVLPVSLIKSIPHTNWSLLTMGIVRLNDAVIDTKSKWQVGGAILANYHANSHVTYKFGIYVNGEFFGLFVIPLVGIDWKIDEKNNLFGVLPASINYEHQLSHRFYAGACFRTFTNSYHDAEGNYWRIDENQLGLFFDAYASKRIVFNLEGGYSLFRKIRTGSYHDITYNLNAENNLYFKCMVAYRIRMR
ncbi:MAG TPA: DUF6268 family outer membrane beta-barrel protein [Puia sp.]|nr:DUF6268 family outer membrane beta-barrel protein [Puia sp.]